jgi:hypothetical protein
VGRSRLIGVVIIATATTVSAGAQARRAATQTADPTVAVAVALKAGGDAYNFTGRGTCTYAPVAGIYDLRAEQWRVEQSGAGGGVTLTFWHPASGADMFTLSVTAGGTRSAVNTVKVGGKGTVEGSGTVTLAREGKGGTFTVAASTAKGARVTGTIKCDAFTPAIAEGGD